MSKKQKDNSINSDIEELNTSSEDGESVNLEESNDVSDEGVQQEITTAEVTEKKEYVDVPKPQTDIDNKVPPVIVKKQMGLVIALISIFISLAVVAGGYYIFLQQENTNNKIKASIPNEKIKQLTAAISNQKNMVVSLEDSLAGELTKIATKSRGLLGQEIVRLEKELQKNKQGQLVLENDIGQIKKVAVKRKLDWTLSEVKYLINIASHKLTFQQDIPTAVAALATAEQKIRDLRNEELYDLRQAIVDDINNLKGTKLPSIEAIAKKLSALEKKIRELPTKKPVMSIAKQQVIADEEPVSASEDITWEQRADRAWTIFKKSLSDYIVLRDDDSEYEPLMSPQKREYLNQNIELKIQTSLIALANIDGTMFNHNMIAIDKWITTYFDNNDGEVMKVKEMIWELKRTEINPTIPGVEQSLKLLEIEQAKLYKKRTQQVSQNQLEKGE